MPHKARYRNFYMCMNIDVLDHNLISNNFVNLLNDSGYTQNIKQRTVITNLAHELYNSELVS